MFKSALSGWFSKPRGFKDGKLERDPLVLLLLGCPGHGKTYLSRNAARSLVGEVCLSSRSLLRFVRSLLRVCEVSIALGALGGESWRMFVDMENLLRLNAFFLEQLRTRYR